MEIGCGARIREFDGRRYFYFWHYERDNGRSVRKEDYVGRVDSERGRSDLLLPPEVRTGIRPAAGADRGLRRSAYLYLEVHAQGRHSTSRRAIVSRVRLPCPIAVR